MEYHPVAIGVAALLTFMILVYFARLSPTKTPKRRCKKKSVNRTVFTCRTKIPNGGPTDEGRGIAFAKSRSACSHASSPRRYVFPVDRPPIENGLVTIDGEWILEVGRYDGEADTIDLGDVAIIPGFVNAHTHLEFSDLEKPLGEPGMLLPSWIRAVIEQRSRGERPPLTPYESPLAWLSYDDPRAGCRRIHSFRRDNDWEHRNAIVHVGLIAREHRGLL